MKYRLLFTNSYVKRVKKFLRRHPDIVSQYKKTLHILEINPEHPSLRRHQLKGRLKKLHSVSINISYRITLEFYIAEKEIILVNIGHHDDVY